VATGTGLSEDVRGGEEAWNLKYVLLFVETEKFERNLEAMSQADRDRAYELVGKWFADNAEKIRGGNKLRPAYTATTVRLDSGDEPVVTDGPFVEGKEVVSGYTEVDVADLDEAIRMVSTWPGCPIVEIRPLES
jgi:hypothetical protein